MFRVEGHYPFNSWNLNCAQFTNSRSTLCKNTKKYINGPHAYSTRCLLANLVILVVLVALVVLGRESDTTGRYIHSFSEFPPKGFIEGLLPSPKTRIGYPKDVQLPWEQITSLKVLYWPTDLCVPLLVKCPNLVEFLWEVPIPAKAPFPGSLIMHPSWSSCHGDSIPRCTSSYPISFNSYLPLA